MSSPLSVALPFGLRDCKIFPYLDEQGTIPAETGFDLPYAQTFSFADSETYTDLRGDDELIATHGNGAQVKWTLEAGGIDIAIWSVFTGGQIIETGAAPNRTITLRKCSDDSRPYFRIIGQVMSDSGGDITGDVYRAKCNGDIKGQFGDGKFFVTSADGVGLPIPGTRLLYDINQHESDTYLDENAPPPIPIVPPKNLVITGIAATTAGAMWQPVTGATAYRVRYKKTADSSWTNVVSDPTVNSVSSLGTLVTATEYEVQVATKIGTDIGYFSDSVIFTTL